MKLAVLAVVLLMFSVSSQAQDSLSAVGANDSRWRIYKNGTCELDSVIKIVPPGRHVEWRPAQVTYPDKEYKACWWVAPNKLVYFIFEDGDVGIFEISDFKRETGV